MGRSRITRTFHNKPKPTIRASNKPSTGTNPKNKVKQVTKGITHQTKEYSKNKGGILPQAHAQEEQNVSKTAYKAKSKAKAKAYKIAVYLLRPAKPNNKPKPIH